MQAHILNSLIPVGCADRRGPASYEPTAEFWRLWHGDRDMVRGLRFRPRKSGGRWIVQWCEEEESIAPRVFTGSGRQSQHVAPQVVESHGAAVPYGYQEESIDRLCGILRERGRGIDASDTGAGKTYMGAFVCRRMGLKPIVVCMKSAIGAWKRALIAVGYGDDEIFVNNYEQYVRGNCFAVYDGARFHGGADKLVIVDEVHRCRNRKTKNARLLGRIAASDSYVLLLSATAFESPDKVGPIVSALGLCEAGYMGERRWMSAHGCFSSGSGYGRRLVFCGRGEYL